jgi:hypothetical protein
MFPERVERIVLDGNVNPHTYQQGDYISTSVDLKPAFDGFLQTCFEAKNDCALYKALQPNTTDDFITAFNAVLAPFASNVTTEGIAAYLSYVTLKAQVQQNMFVATHVWS